MAKMKSYKSKEKKESRIPFINADYVFSLVDVNALMPQVGVYVEKQCGEFFGGVAKSARQNIEENGSVRTGLLKKAVDFKTASSFGGAKGSFIWAGVGISRKIKGVDENLKPVKPTKYAHLVEYGHDKGKNKRGGDVKPKPFMRMAMAEAGGVGGANNMLTNAFKDGIERALS